jgi:EmrB/QacA subfamily drug resistance transporter
MADFRDVSDRSGAPGEPAPVARVVREPKNVARIMFGLMLALFLANLDQTIIATCLPAMARQLGGWELLPWVISAYLVTSTATTPIYGRLSDSYGRRRVLLGSIALFVIASALCALAHTMPLLILARALQGVGGGGLRSISQIVIADIIPPRNRGRYQGYMSATFLISTTLGPVLGGYFAEHWSWTWAFWINLPLGALAFVVVDRQLRQLALPVHSHKIDWIGAALILLSASPFMLGLSRVEQAGGWGHAQVLIPIVIGLVMALVLVLHEMRVAEPMLPMRLFAIRTFSIGNIALFAPSMVMTALIVLIPLFFQIVLDRPADNAGLQLIPLTGGMAVGSFIVGSTVARIGRARIFPILGGIIGAALCVTLAKVGLGNSHIVDFVCTGLLGMTFGAQINPMLVIVQNSLDVGDMGAGVSGMTFFRSLAGAFGVAVFTTFLITRLSAGALSLPRHEVLGGEPGVALLRGDWRNVFSAAEAKGFVLVQQNAFADTFLLAAGILCFAVVATLFINERPLRAASGRLG